MQDPKAAQIYASLDVHIHLATLADNYLQSKLSGNTSECLAIEKYLRDLARIHFPRPEVREALNSMERHKRMRKPGTGAPKALQAIADQIETRYSEYDFYTLLDGRIMFRVELADNKYIKLTCKNSPGQVALLAAKYRRGLPPKFGSGKA